MNFHGTSILSHEYCPHSVSQVVLMVKNHLPTQEMSEMQARFLSQEDPLEKEVPTHSSIFAWRILWTEEPGGLQSLGSQE